MPVVKGDGTLAFIGNLIRTNIDMRTSYLDKFGDIVWSQNKFIPLNSHYRVMVSGRTYELKDLFKEDSNYVQVLSEFWSSFNF